jgi:hypothetical protein
MNLQYMGAKEASDNINTMNVELSDFDIKAALINALDRIAQLEKLLASAGGQSEQEQAKPTDLQAAIMDLPCEPTYTIKINVISYTKGFREAQKAAAELVARHLGATPAQEG